MTQKTSYKDIEKLSAYLDQQLSRSEQARLEARLAQQSELHEILQDLRHTRALLKQTPRRRVPRNFILTPKMVGLRPPLPRSVPAFRLASLTAAFLLFLSFTFNYLAPIIASPSMAAAPQMFQSGGGCGFDDPADCGDVAMESVPFGMGGGVEENATPGEETAMSMAPEALDVPTPEGTPEASLRVMPDPTQADANLAPTDLPAADAPASEKSQPQRQPFLNTFQTGLVILVLFFGSIAVLVRQFNILRWRKRL
jgi:hypothetical protein